MSENRHRVWRRVDGLWQGFDYTLYTECERSHYITRNFNCHYRHFHYTSILGSDNPRSKLTTNPSYTIDCWYPTYLIAVTDYGTVMFVLARNAFLRTNCVAIAMMFVRPSVSVWDGRDIAIIRCSLAQI